MIYFPLYPFVQLLTTVKSAPNSTTNWTLKPFLVETTSTTSVRNRWNEQNLFSSPLGLHKLIPIPWAGMLRSIKRILFLKKSWSAKTHTHIRYNTTTTQCFGMAFMWLQVRMTRRLTALQRYPLQSQITWPSERITCRGTKMSYHNDRPVAGGGGSYARDHG